MLEPRLPPTATSLFQCMPTSSHHSATALVWSLPKSTLGAPETEGGKRGKKKKKKQRNKKRTTTATSVGSLVMRHGGPLDSPLSRDMGSLQSCTPVGCMLYVSEAPCDERDCSPGTFVVVQPASTSSCSSEPGDWGGSVEFAPGSVLLHAS